MAKKISVTGQMTTLNSKPIALEEIVVRIVREGDKLVFEWKVNDAWETFSTLPIEADLPALNGGIFLATEKEQSIRVGFDYAMLIDPSAVSPLKGSLGLSEIMYNPIGGAA